MESVWKTSTFSKHLQQVSNSVLTLPNGIGAQLYRQLSIAIAERHVVGGAATFDRYDEASAGYNDSIVFAWQSGHRPRQRHSTYGLDGAFPDKLQPALLRLYLEASKKWHHFLKMSENERQNCKDTQNSRIRSSPLPTTIDTSRKRHYDIMSESEDESAGSTGGLKPSRRHFAPSPDHINSVLDASVLLPSIPDVISQEEVVVNRLEISAHANSIGPFIHLQNLNVVACQDCRFAVCPDEITTHLSRGAHKGRYKMSERKDIQHQVNNLPEIIRTQAELIEFVYPPRDSPPILCIAPPKTDGMLCNACPYISRQIQGIQNYCRKVHGWKNDWNRTNNFYGISQEDREVPWT